MHAVPPASADIAVVIPTLDEQESLESLLPEVVAWAAEVVVSDAGSRDRTVQIARHHGARVVLGAPGRGSQLDRGARSTTAPILLFLHADTRLPPQAEEEIREAVNQGFLGGGFRVRFSGGTRLATLGSKLVNLRTRLTGCPLGDQAQFCTRPAYEEVDGFPDWPILEDLDLIRRLKREGQVTLLPSAVTTSFRRYRKGGVLRTIVTNWLIWALFFIGVSPHRLGGLYRKVR